MKMIKTDQYSVLLLRAALTGDIEKSRHHIFHAAYGFSRTTISYFPLPYDLIDKIDQIFDPIVDELGTNYSGLRYLHDLDEKNTDKLLRGAKYFISDDERILNIAIVFNKPCIFFDENGVRWICISDNAKTHKEISTSLGLQNNAIRYYESMNCPVESFNNINTYNLVFAKHLQYQEIAEQ